MGLGWLMSEMAIFRHLSGAKLIGDFLDPVQRYATTLLIPQLVLV